MSVCSMNGRFNMRRVASRTLVGWMALILVAGCNQPLEPESSGVAETETAQLGIKRQTTEANSQAQTTTSAIQAPVNTPQLPAVNPSAVPAVNSQLPEPSTEPREPTFQDSRRHKSLVGLATSFPWAGDRNGGWNGTGHEDPEPLKKFSDEEMLKLAMNMADNSDDRQHALVSVGRRKMPGAIDALAAALSDHKEIYQVREMGLSGLIEHGGPEALKLMWKALKEDPSEGIRGMAIWGIALYGTAEAEAAVMHGLSDEHPNVKGMAVLAVWAMKDNVGKALSILADTAKVSERVIWQESLNVLSRMPYPEAANTLYSIAASETGAKQQSAAMYYRLWLKNYPDLSPGK